VRTVKSVGLKNRGVRGREFKIASTRSSTVYSSLYLYVRNSLPKVLFKCDLTDLIEAPGSPPKWGERG